jgi:hypothetical protein
MSISMLLGPKEIDGIGPIGGIECLESAPAQDLQ